MNTRNDGTTPSSEPLDLTQETEDTRRKLYDAAVATHFTGTPEEQEKAAEHPESWQPPAVTPDVDSPRRRGGPVPTAAGL